VVHALQKVALVRGELENVRDRAVAIAHEAGRLMLEGFRRSPDVRSKRSRSDLVTEYDERCEALIRQRLDEAFPGVSIVGEEGGGEREGASAWYVDPIDGTSNFAHGHPFFCVSLGLWEGTTPLAGVVHAPAMGLTYAAARGAGTTRNDDRVRVSGTRELADALLATGFPSDRATSERNNYREFIALDRATHGVRRCAAAALELSLVSDGGYDGFWDRGLSPWDLAAGSLFVLEAGGEVTDLSGAPLALEDRGTYNEAGVVASNGALHASLLSALAHARALPPIPGVT
jgi:myo-inositol-1(or 4)-monophosphatase